LKKLTKKELARYARHLSLPEFGIAGQEKLKNTSVLVIGAGGLGSPMLQYLAAAGIGKIGIVDFDKVDLSNLQRQILYGVDDVGKYKAEVAAQRIRSINPNVEVDVFLSRFEASNALEIMEPYSIIADGTDNFPTRYLVNDACVIQGKINVHGSIFRFDGQVSVFNYLNDDGTRGPNYRDLYPEPPPPGTVPNCAEGGVLGILPGMIGCIQASEVIKIAAQLGEVLTGKLFVMDVLSMQARVLKFKSNPESPKIEELIDYVQFCSGVSAQENLLETQRTASQKVQVMKEITVQELKELRDAGTTHQLIDVREPFEFEIAEIGGELIPLADVVHQPEKVKKDCKVILHCRSGMRSANAIRVLEEHHGFDNLYNLKGGILAWSKEIDSTVEEY
jgi:molybdopterin/thiamine biosynthesis adenylyltransferase/rhodanese-related sulfurtransferase